MKAKVTPYRYKKERVIITDILPYEIPLIFSNRYFYDFLTDYKISLDHNKLTWEFNDKVLAAIIQLIFGGKKDENENRIIISNFGTIPFNYKISHKSNDFRELTIIHPKSQVQIVEFYEQYQSLMMYYSSISQFSLRKPYKIARSIYFNDETHKKKLAYNHRSDALEENSREYENLKTFFAYKSYSNIHKFYESYKYHRCEKKYHRLFKFDISKCFDSIYSHSICWALLNKDSVKENIDLSRKTFSGKFDSLMQNLNYGETHGIVIGPEFSRIFAELILQHIDRKVLLLLKEDHKLYFKKDFEIFRYVDDYFIFYNDEAHKELIVSIFRLQLKSFKLYLNDSKAILYDKPIITEITIAKQKISDLLNKYLDVEFVEQEMSEDSSKDDEKNGTLYISSNKLITKYKSIIKETNTVYKDVLNYTFAIIERKVERIILNKDKLVEKVLIRALLEVLEFTFFIYSVSPRVNTTIKLCQILRHLTKLLKDKETNINIDHKHLIYKYIFDNTKLILWINKTSDFIQIETLYLLIALRELGREYLLDTDSLCSYFNILHQPGEKIIFSQSLNYFSLIVLLFYMKDKQRYKDLKEAVKLHIVEKFKSNMKNLSLKTENVLLFFDVMTCPYLDLNYKKELLTLYGVSDEYQDDIISFKQTWFTKWKDFNFFNELEAKKSKEVY